MRPHILTFGLSLALFVACSGSDFSSKADSGTGGAAGAATGGASAGGSNTGGGGTGGNTTGGTGPGGASGGTVASGGTGGVTPPPPWCDGHPGVVLCEDFDSYASADAFLNSWTTFSSINGTLAFDDGLSAPNALRVQSTSTTDVKTSVSKTLTLGSVPSSIRFDFALELNTVAGIASLSGAVIAAIILGTDINTDGVVGLEIGPNNGGFGLYTVWLQAPADGGNLSLGSQYLMPLPTLGQWAGRFALEIKYSKAADAAAAACVQAYAGGVAQAGCAALSPSMSIPSTTYTVALGIQSVSIFSPATTGTIDVKFDNVLVTTQ